MRRTKIKRLVTTKMMTRQKKKTTMPLKVKKKWEVGKEQKMFEQNYT